MTKDDFKAARASLGLNQTDLAAQLGVTQSTVSRFETGEQPIDTRTKLALNALLALHKPSRSRAAA